MSSLPLFRPLPQPRTRVHLIRGDCLRVMTALPKKSFGMIFADLPYGITAAYWDCVINSKEFIFKAKELVTDTATIAMTATQPFATDLINANREAFKYEIIWHRVRPKGHLLANFRPMRLHENILIFGKKQLYYPQKWQGLPSSQRLRTVGALYREGSSRIVSANPSGMKHPTSVLKVDESELFSSSKNKKRLHPTQKPIALLEWLIKTYTNPGDTILDPTAGSMTTAIAAMRTGRHVVCIERDHAYFDAGVARVRAERARLDAGEG